MRFIDTHTHIYDESLLPEFDIILDNAKSNGIDKMIMPGIDSSSIHDMLLQ
jgi:Tat protein secretion system quality control protein TatD with DNase activity